MAQARLAPHPRSNRLLLDLPSAEAEALGLALRPMALPQNQVVYENLEPIACAVFPDEGVVSLVRIPENGLSVENVVVGYEGMVGVNLILGTDRTPSRAIVQVRGAGHCLPTPRLRELVTPSTVLYGRLLRYAQYMLEAMAQGMACNRTHALEQRCARWLLMCQDRVRDDRYTLTQAFLAQMLGVRRSSVSVAAQEMATRGLIRYSRGIVTVLDRTGLEETACCCYRRIDDEYVRLLGPVG